MTTRRKSDDAGAADTSAPALLRSMCGEARAPLEGIVAVAGRLALQPMTPDAKACVQTIVDTAQALLRRFDQTLALAEGEGAGQPAGPQGPVQIRELIDDVQSAWQPRAAHGVSLLVSYDGDPDLACAADGAKLRRLLDCLVGSALRVTSRGAVEVRLRARVQNGKVRLEGRVRDAGASLRPGLLDHIFEAGPASPANAGPSLPLSREIVRALGGTIRAEANPGAGASILFELDLPVAAAGAAEPAAAAASAAHVLVVDDNATNRMVAQSLCEMFGCTCEAVEDGLEAVEAARTGRFDVILMDIKMPRMDGLEATRAIRALPGAAGAVPIIALTANADPEDVRAYLACGMCDVVEKPINPERLLQSMNAAFDAKAAQAAAAGTRAA